MDDRLSLCQRREGALNLLRCLKEQPVAGEEFAPIGLRNRAKPIFLLRQPSRQRGCRLTDEFRRRCPDDDDDLFEAAEGLLECNLAFAPFEVGREQHIDVRGDGEIPGRVDPGSQCQEQSKNHHRQSVARAELDDTDDQGCWYRRVIHSNAPSVSSTASRPLRCSMAGATSHVAFEFATYFAAAGIFARSALATSAGCALLLMSASICSTCRENTNCAGR